MMVLGEGAVRIVHLSRGVSPTIYMWSLCCDTRRRLTWSRGCPSPSSHARVLEGVNSCKSVPTFENNCLEGEMTFGDPFEDSGVVRIVHVSRGASPAIYM